MSKLSKDECLVFNGSYLSLACMGIGSIILKFLGQDSRQISIVINSKFEWTDRINKVIGDGNDPITVSSLYPILNLTILNVCQSEEGILQINFENNGQLEIFPNVDGFESYVIYLPGSIGGLITH